MYIHIWDHFMQKGYLSGCFLFSLHYLLWTNISQTQNFQSLVVVNILKNIIEKAFQLIITWYILF